MKMAGQILRGNKRYNNWLITKAQAGVRYYLCHTLGKALPLWMVTEYPKSGGTWVASVLADLLHLPLYRNQFSRINSQVVHCHYRYHPSFNNVFCVIRDGRDVMISFYYHSLYLRDDGLNYHEFAATTRELKITDPENIQKNLPRFLEYKFKTRVNPKFTWSEFIRGWLDKNVPLIKYEMMLKSPEKEIKSALSYYSVNVSDHQIAATIDKYSFKNLSGRERGREDKKSFLRKGIAGDWKTHFSPEARQVFNYYAGDTLRILGYETSDNWLE